MGKINVQRQGFLQTCKLIGDESETRNILTYLVILLPCDFSTAFKTSMLTFVRVLLVFALSFGSFALLKSSVEL